MRDLQEIAALLGAADRDRFIELVHRVAPETEFAPTARPLEHARRAAAGDFTQDFLESATLTDDVHHDLPTDPGRSSAGPEDLTRGPSWQIDDYVVKAKIKSGGQGTVFLAYQPHTERKVALKLLRQGSTPTPEYLTRFRTEYRALAQMNHQNIARIFQAGTTPNGSPYFSMEYVEGGSVTEYCRTHDLPFRARMALFEQICAGVFHAHQRLILHRDLKPQNLLVTESEGRPVVKIVDFGIAKDLAPHGLDDGITEGILGTPAYIAPEFLGADKPEPDTRTDMYALGVVLYELLTDGSHLKLPKKLSVDDHWRYLREAEPERPSQHLCRACAGSARGLDLRDLDAVVLKAMAREPERRYTTVAALMDDCRALVAGRPVQARVPSPLYLARKLIRRHKLPAAAVAAVLLALCIGLVTTTLARRDAERAGRRFRASYETLADVFSAPDPYQMGRNARVFDVLRNREQRFSEDFADDPALEARFRLVWGRTYFALGAYPRARDQFEAALSLHERGEADPADALEARRMLAATLSRQGAYAEAEAALRMLQEGLASAPVPPEAKLEVLTDLAGVLHRLKKNEDATAVLAEAGRYTAAASDTAARASYTASLANAYHDLGNSEAEQLYRRAVDLWHGLGAEGQSGMLSTMSNLANHLRTRGKYREAEALYRQLIEARERMLGPDHHLTLKVWSGLGLLLNDRGNYEEAQAIFDKVRQGLGRLGEDHPDTLSVMRRQANIYRKNGKNAESEALLREVMARYEANGLEQSFDALKTAANLGDLYIEKGAHEEAVALLTRTLSLMRKVYGENNRNTPATMMTLGQALDALGRAEEADAYYAEAVGLMTTFRPNDPQCHYYKAIQADSLGRRGRYAEAEPRLLDAYAAVAPGSAAATEIRGFLYRHYSARGMTEQAGQYR